MSGQINLFNPRFEAQTMVFGATATVRALGLLLLGCAALTLVGQYYAIEHARALAVGSARVVRAQARLDQVNLAFAPRQRSKTLAAELAGVEAKSALLRDATSAVERGELGNKVGHAGLFKALARQTTAGVWLTAIAIDGDDGAIALQGRAQDAVLVPAYLLRLGREPLLQGRRFGGMRIGPLKSGSAGTGAFVEFSLDSGVAVAGHQGGAGASANEVLR